MFDALMRFICRFRYPVSLPEDIALDLGINLPNTLNFQEFLKFLSSPHHRPSKIRKFMEREKAERTFCKALKCERFKTCSFFSYYFKKNWLVIALHFDDKDRLRRMYLQCPASEKMDGFDIILEEESYARNSTI